MGPLVCVIFLLVLGLTDSLVEYNPDTHLKTPQLVVKNGYPLEAHTVLTEDGYLLTLHRIPYGRKKRMQHGEPVIVQHGLAICSACWVLLGPGKALPYLLADAGYDVWLGNARGNTYSTDHVKYSTKTREYWDFSFHEMGVFDMPAVIDYILEWTGRQKLKYIGHSMGITMLLVLLSEHPQYNDKIEAVAALAPAAYNTHAPSPIRDFLLTRGFESMMSLLKWNGRFDFFQTTDNLLGAMRRLCRDNARVSKLVCENFLHINGGFNTTQLNSSLVPVILGHMPAGSSLKTIHHYAQYMRNGRFCKYDYGKKMNNLVYGAAQPPLYKVENSKVPMFVFYSDHDGLVPRVDVEILCRELPNLVGIYRVPLSQFNHLDFVWGNDAKTLVYDTVMQFLNKTF